jgi:hypothetical protein
MVSAPGSEHIEHTEDSGDIAIGPVRRIIDAAIIVGDVSLYYVIGYYLVVWVVFSAAAKMTPYTQAEAMSVGDSAGWDYRHQSW